MNTGQVSEETGIPAATLRYWRHANIGPASFSLGKRVVYRRSEVERWIAEQEQATRRGGGAAGGAPDRGWCCDRSHSADKSPAQAQKSLHARPVRFYNCPMLVTSPSTQIRFTPRAVQRSVWIAHSPAVGDCVGKRNPAV